MYHRPMGPTPKHRRRTRSRCAPLLVAAGAVTLAACAAADGQRGHPGNDSARSSSPVSPALFRVRILRPSHVGDRFVVFVDAERRWHMVVTASGTTVRELTEGTRVRFEATEQVVSVNTIGRPLASEFTIRRFELTDDGGTRTVLPPGEVVTLLRASRPPDASITVAGAPANRAVRDAVSIAVPLTASDTPDDEVFGSAEPQPVGASWPVNGDLLDRVTAGPAGFDAHTTGESRLTQRLIHEGIDTLELVSMTSTRIVSIPNAPLGAVLHEGIMRGQFRRLMPVAADARLLRTESRLEGEIVLDLPPSEGPNQQSVTTTMLSQDTRFARADG